MDKKCALITGAGSGIGRAVAIAFARDGYRLTLIGRTRSSLEETASLCEVEPHIVAADVTIEAEVELAFDASVERAGRLDLLFNGAGQFGAEVAIDDVSLADWSRVLNSNLTGSFLCARAAFRRMKTQGPPGGRILNCGSISAHSPRPRTAAYTASKHAITGLTKSIALEGRQFGISCSQLDIGNAATAMTGNFAKGTLQADGSVKPEPMMNVTAVAEAALFIAGLPPEANVLNMTVMAMAMPFVGRG